MISRLIFNGTLLSVLIPLLVQISTGALKDEHYLDSIACGPRTKISLLPNKTLIIKLSRWSDYHRGLSFLNFQCRFQVVAPRGYGIMAIIQHLHLRHKNALSSSCRDYVKFEQSDGLDAGPICGEIYEGDQTEKPKGLVGPRSFYDPKGLLDVAFRVDDSLIEEIQKPFKLEIAFTAYTECTSTSLLTRQVRQCSQSRSYSCISDKLFCDGIINCGTRGPDFGNDEANCNSAPSSILPPFPNVASIPVNHDGPIHRVDFGRSNQQSTKIVEPSGPANGLLPKITTKITVTGDDDNNRYDAVHLGIPVQVFALVSAISGALVVLLVFFVCCCIIRNFSKRNVMGSQAGTSSGRTIEINLNHTGIPLGHVNPSGRGHGGIHSSKSSDDLPPSYEAIFPEPVPPKR